MEYLHDKQMESESEARRPKRDKKSHDSRTASRDQDDEVGYNKEATPPHFSGKNEVYNLLWSHQ